MFPDLLTPIHSVGKIMEIIPNPSTIRYHQNLDEGLFSVDGKWMKMVDWVPKNYRAVILDGKLWLWEMIML
jgi:hypothetical protein